MSESDQFVLRIVDANLNRAREALRVVEEYARFALDDRELTERVKSLRHGLRSVVAQFIADDLIMHRSIETDVGREVQTPSEYIRDDATAVVRAAAKRAAEALRVIEEYGKTIDAAFGMGVEQLRYELYAIEQQVAAVTVARERFGRVRLYVIITGKLCRADWLETATSALEGGADCLQLREKDLTDRELLQRAKTLAEVCRKFGKLCIVNDRPDVAAAAGADGVHLGQDDLPVAGARKLLPKDALIGLSTHNPDQARLAAAAKPDYMAVGPMFPTALKPHCRVAGPDTLSKVRSEMSLPLVAIGGVTLENGAALVEAGASALCVCTAVIQSPDPTAAARALRHLVTRNVEATASPGADDSAP